MVSAEGTNGATREKARPATRAGSARANPVSGPLAPTSKSCRLKKMRDLMRMNAPNVPMNGGPGRKNGRVAGMP